MSDVPDVIGVRFEGGPLAGHAERWPRMALDEVIRIPVGGPADLTGECVCYRLKENIVHRDTDGSFWVRYDHDPLYKPPDLPGDLPDEIGQQPGLRHVINDALEAWPAVSDRDMPSWWYDPDELKELARHIRDAIAGQQD